MTGNTQRHRPRARVTARFTGRVQGVGFRYTTVRIAQHHGVTGYARNESDGGVQVVAEGERSDLERFLQELAASSVGRHVRDTQTVWGPETGAFSEFEIRYF